MFCGNMYCFKLFLLSYFVGMCNELFIYIACFQKKCCEVNIDIPFFNKLMHGLKNGLAIHKLVAVLVDFSIQFFLTK